MKLLMILENKMTKCNLQLTDSDQSCFLDWDFLDGLFCSEFDRSSLRFALSSSFGDAVSVLNRNSASFSLISSIDLDGDESGVAAPSSLSGVGCRVLWRSSLSRLRSMAFSRPGVGSVRELVAFSLLAHVEVDARACCLSWLDWMTVPTASGGIYPYTPRIPPGFSNCTRYPPMKVLQAFSLR